MPEIVWPHFIAGWVLCLAGWTLYWIGLHLAGGIVGGLIGFVVAWVGSALVELDTRELWWIPHLGAVSGFAAGIFLIRGLHRFFFFFVGAALGLAVGKLGYDGLAAREEWIEPNAAVWQTVCIGLGSVLGGMAMVWGSRWIVALVTSVSGSLLVVLSISDPLALLVFVPLAPTSFFLQIGFLRRLGPKRPAYAEVEDED